MKSFSQNVTLFHNRQLPEEDMILAGYSALIHMYDLEVPLPDMLCAISAYTRHYEKGQWKVYSPRYQPAATLSAHITFALKYEPLDLYILNALFKVINPKEIEEWIIAEPTGRYSRKVWFLYEWLLGKKLNIPDVQAGNYVNVLDPDSYYVGEGVFSPRHRINNNLPGNSNFCPLVSKTEKLKKYEALDLKNIAQKLTGAIHPDILMRACSFLLLKDSRASFAIEGEFPSANRAERWGRALGQAGSSPLSIEELERLQKIVIGDQRFVALGLRQEGGFIGIHDRTTGHPIPDHISARWQDLPLLMKSLLETYTLMKKSGIDPIVIAAVISFGFVFIHPFEDGNGRLHRYLMHHVLSECHFVPRGILFPISSVILERIEDYRKVLESYSKRRLEFIKWSSTDKGNVEVENETLDLYRFFDATKQAEFLYECVSETISKTLPTEIDYLERYDRMRHVISENFEMPSYLEDLLIQFLRQNNGNLSKRALEKEFRMLNDQEIKFLEASYKDIFQI